MISMSKALQIGGVLIIITVIIAAIVKYGSDRYDHGYLNGYTTAEEQYKKNEHDILLSLQKFKEAAIREKAGRTRVEVQLQEILNRPKPKEVTHVEAAKDVNCTKLDGIIRVWNYYAEMSRNIDDIRNEGGD
jgi:hypothetical protein